jgi:hypothetical protein
MTFQSYPAPTELPAFRAGEAPDGRYLDCTPGLAPTGDTFVSIPTLTIARINGEPLDANDLVSAGSLWQDTFKGDTMRIPTYGFIAPAGAGSRTYRLTISGATAQGRLFVRDWIVSVLPWMG